MMTTSPVKRLPLIIRLSKNHLGYREGVTWDDKGESNRASEAGNTLPVPELQ